MAIPVTKFKGLDPACAGRHRLVERVGPAAGEGGLSILPPHTVQRLEPRCREALPCPIEPCVQVGTSRGRGMGSSQLEIPSQLVTHLGLDGSSADSTRPVSRTGRWLGTAAAPRSEASTLGGRGEARQESCLTLGEALLGDRMNASIEGHRSSSSMMLGVRPPPPPRFDQ